jgi:hypothetical protein
VKHYQAPLTIAAGGIDTGVANMGYQGARPKAKRGPKGSVVAGSIFTVVSSCRVLCGRLAKGPGGRPWQDTTIRGQKERGTGILNNELYVGRIAWNLEPLLLCERSAHRQAPRAHQSASETCAARAQCNTPRP